LVEFADRFQRFFHPAVMIESLPNLRSLFGAQTKLARLSARIADIQNPLQMTFAARALGTAAGMISGSLEQGTAQDSAEIGEPGQ